MDLKVALRIKYGLQNDPTDEQVQQWANSTRIAIAQGESAESAGRVAAYRNFSDVGTVKYAAEADTITSLLDEVKKRGGR